MRRRPRGPNRHRRWRHRRRPLVIVILTFGSRRRIVRGRSVADGHRHFDCTDPLEIGRHFFQTSKRLYLCSLHKKVHFDDGDCGRLNRERGFGFRLWPRSVRLERFPRSLVGALRGWAGLHSFRPTEEPSGFAVAGFLRPDLIRELSFQSQLPTRRALLSG